MNTGDSLASPGVEELHRLVIGGSEEELALVVEGQGGEGAARLEVLSKDTRRLECGLIRIQGRSAASVSPTGERDGRTMISGESVIVAGSICAEVDAAGFPGFMIDGCGVG